jgi:hypothetical protein
MDTVAGVISSEVNVVNCRDSLQSVTDCIANYEGIPADQRRLQFGVKRRRSRRGRNGVTEKVCDGLTVCDEDNVNDDDNDETICFNVIKGIHIF